MNIESGWKTTYIWKLKPNGDWTNGNAPINLFVQFNKAHDDVRKIRFTIVNPHLLNEQFSGFNIIPTRTTTTDPSSTDQPQSQGSPGFGVAGALLGILLSVVHKGNPIIQNLKKMEFD